MSSALEQVIIPAVSHLAINVLIAVFISGVAAAINHYRKLCIHMSVPKLNILTSIGH